MIGAAARPTAPVPPVLDERVRERIRLLAFCLLLMVLSFVTAPGRIIADTKLDLAINPAGFLARALALWDPQQFGQLQDQAAGYLFPMGPFFYLGKLAALQPWVIQRLWIGTLAMAAFLGTVRLAARLGIGSPWTRVAAGFAYAASPAGLTLLGELSAEFLPTAMLPWILIPLVDAAHGGRRGRAAVRSAAAAGLCGGTNATATAAVLLPAVFYLLTAASPAPRWRILGWWVPAVLAATWWWLVPLALLWKYGVPIIPYTESAAAVTSSTGLSQILRGTENWLSYLVVDGQPWWQVGYKLATGTSSTVLTGVVAGLGLAGLISRGLAARRFLLGLLLLGAVIVSAGHLSTLGAPLAAPVDDVLNGLASPLRNLQKFDPLIRLPVVLGLAHLLATARLPRLRPALAAIAGLAIGGMALPVYTGGAAMAGSFSQIPSYWMAAANWLNRHAGHQAVLVVPGAPFGQYLWGSPLDDVLQPLTTVDWAERNLATVGSPGNARLLDAIDQQLAAGAGSPGLAPVLARMGVRYLVVRNDLNRAVLSGAWPARVSQALASSPGIIRVARFGLLPAGSPVPDDAVSNFDPPYPPVEIYRVAGIQPVATVQPDAGTLRVYGGPEAELTLASEGLLGNRPVLLNGDSPRLPTAGSVVTDSLRRRVRNFGELRGSYSPTLTAHGPAQTFEAASDYLDPGWSRYFSVARYQGVRSVTASSSAADIGALPAQWASGLLPYAAVDGDPRTMWESGSWTGPVGQWIRLRFDHPVDVPAIWVSFADSSAMGPPVTRVTVRTAAGQVTDQVLATGNEQLLRMPPGVTGWLQLTVAGLASRLSQPLGSQVGIKDIRVPGVRASREIAAPGVPGPQTAVVLAKAQPWPSGCMLTSLRWVCSPALARPAEEQYGFGHAFTAAAPGPAELWGSAVMTSRWLAGKYLAINPAQARVRASSTYTGDLQDAAGAAFDANPDTAWTASPADPHPVLTVTWSQPRTVNRVTFQRPPGASGLLQVVLSGSRGQVRGATIGPSGIMRFAPMRTSKLTFIFTPLQAPLQISGLGIPGVPQLGTPSLPLRLPCGFGPNIQVDGKAVPTRVSGTFADLRAGRPLRFTACFPVQLQAGANQVVEPGWDAYSVQDVVVRTRPLPAVRPAPAARAQILAWTPSHRVLRVAARTASYLVVNENFNAGWQAVSQGRRLQAVRLDGWKQAWLLPAGSVGVVTLTYQPERIYRAAIGGGLGSLAIVLVLAAGSWMRDRRRPFTGGRGVSVTAAGSGAASSRRCQLATGVSAALRWASLGGLALAGLWLGGYPGAVLLPAVSAGFLILGYWRPGWLLIAGSPWLMAGLAMALSGCSALGEHLLLAGPSGPVVAWLTSGIPQIIGLIMLGRLAAALAVPGGPPSPGPAAAGLEPRSGSS